MSPTWHDLFATLDPSPSEPSGTRLSGYIVPEHSTPEIAAFATDPCSASWHPIPASLIERVEPHGLESCATRPERRLARVTLLLRTVDPQDALAFALVHALRTLESAPPAGGDIGRARRAFGAPVAPRDLRLEFTRFGSLTNWRIWVEDHEVKAPPLPTADDTFVYLLPHYPVTGSLDVELVIQGVNGATGTLVVKVDAVAKEPPLRASVLGGVGRDSRSYSV